MSTQSQSTKVTTYVNQQLDVARRQVKSTDLISGLLAILAIALGILIVAALWDGWVSPLTSTGRWICLGSLFAAILIYSAIAIAPLLFKKINPQYAARMIEQAKPSFKNSLLNYVLLRKKEDEINPAIFQAVSRQAAENLATVPADATVDRSKLIRWGFVLVGLMLFTVCYKFVSPKDPLQSFRRILFPAAKISHPARVNISEVQPGDTRIFFGDSLEISAVVRGKHHPDDVHVLYSSADGQVRNKHVPMEAESVPGRYRVTIGQQEGGIRQSLVYQIVALDGESPVYDVVVQSNPTIAVEKVTYQPPKYTKLPTQTQIGQGEVDAVEGTKVSIDAVANMPIGEAYLDLLHEIESGSANKTRQYKTAQSIQMTTDGQKAKASFWALLNPSRDKSLATHYQLRFTSDDGVRNQRPNVYPIKVTPDFAPDIRVLQPSQTEINLPENGTLLIDVEANDLDYEISSVKFVLNHQGFTLVQQELELQPISRLQRVKAQFRLQPSRSGLKNGDKAIFFVTAADNRMTSGESPIPDPNVSRSDNFTVNIVAPEKQDPQNNQQANEQPQPQNDEQRHDQKDQNQRKDQNDANQNEKQSPEESQQPSEQQKQDGNQGNDPQQNADDQKQNRDSQSGNNSQSGGDSQSGDPQQSQQPGGKQQQQNNGQQQDTQSQDQQSNQGGDESSDPSESSSKSNSAQSSDSGQNESNQPSGNESGGGQPSNSSPPQGDQQGSGQPSDNSGGSQSGSQGADGSKPLGKDATPAEQIRKLDELLNSSDSGQPQDSPSNGGQPQDNPSNDQPQGTPNSQNNQPGGQTTENGDPSQSNEGQANNDPNRNDQVDPNGQSDSQSTGNQNGTDRDNQQGNQKSQGDPSGDSNPSQGDQQSNGNGQDSNPSQPNKGQQGNSQSSGDSKSNDSKSNPSESSGKSAGDQDQTTDASQDPNRKNHQGGSKNQSSDNQSQDRLPQSDSSQSGDSPSNKSNSDNSKSDDSKSGDSQPGQQQDPSQSGNSGQQQSEGNSQNPQGDQSDPSNKPDSSNQPQSNQNDSKSGQPQNANQQGNNQQNADPKGDSQQGDSKPQSDSQQGDSKQQNDSQQGNNKQSDSQQSDSQQSDSQQSSSQSSNSQSQSQSGSKPGQPQPGQSKQGHDPSNPTGNPSQSSEGSGSDVETAKDELNLEHAKKATDLILKKLSEQQYNPDPKLLEQMNWTQDDLNQFLKRWQEMKQAAASGDAAAKRRYDQMLRSLDFRASSDRRAVRQSKQNVEGLSQDSTVIQPPPEFAPDFNATLRDLNRNRE